MHTLRDLILLAVLIGAAAEARGADAPRGVLQDNVVVLLDASGSMKETMAGGRSRLEVAKAALLQVMGEVPATTNVGLLVFSGRSVGDHWVYPLGPLDREAFARAIERPQPGGGTPLGAYLKIAADRLLEQRAAQLGYGTYRLLVVTDGQASDPGIVDRHLPDVLSRGLTVDVIGLDMRESHALATRVHGYQRGDDADSLVRAVREVFAEVGAAAAGGDGEDAFALIAGMSQETALAAIAALGRAGNHPIGQPPAALPAPAPDAAPSSAPGDGPAAPSSGGGSVLRTISFACFAIVLVAVLVPIVVRLLSKGARR